MSSLLVIIYTYNNTAVPYIHDLLNFKPSILGTVIKCTRYIPYMLMPESKHCIWEIHGKSSFNQYTIKISIYNNNNYSSESMALASFASLFLLAIFPGKCN